MCINSDAMPVMVNARLLQGQRLEEGFPACGLQHHISLKSGVSTAQHHASLGLLDCGGLQSKTQCDAKFFHALAHRIREFLVKAFEDAITADHLGDGHPQALEDAGEFTGDVASSNDQN